MLNAGIFANLGLVFLSGCDGIRSSSETTADVVAHQPTLVNVVRVAEVSDALITEVCFGKLKPDRHASLSFAVPGQVKTVFKRAGDQCTRGEVLAVLSQPELDAQKAQVEAVIPQLSHGPEVAELQAKLKSIDAQLAAGTLVAPFDGLVFECSIKTGSRTSPGMSAMVVVTDGTPFVDATLPKDIAARLVPNQTFWVGTDSASVVLKVASLFPSAESSGSQRLRLDFIDDLPDGSWTLDDAVEIRFHVRTGQTGFWIPLSALQTTSRGQWAVHVLVGADKPVVERRIVEVIQLEDDFALVTGALVDGDKLVVEGGHRIVTGQKVTAVNVSKKFTSPFRQEATE